MKNQQPINSLVLSSEIKQKLITVRGQHTLLDRDAAALYGVETRVINQVVKNNPDKFPAGYVTELAGQEVEALRSKILTLETKPGKGHSNRRPNSPRRGTSWLRSSATISRPIRRRRRLSSTSLS